MNMQNGTNNNTQDVYFEHQSDEAQHFTGASFLVHALVSAGVTHVFGGHGGAVVPLIDAIEANPYITWVYCRCEVNASQMAAAYAKLHQGKKIGCCVATSGPGAGHLLSGLVDADQDRVPVLCITGMKDSGHIRHADFQDIDQASIFRMAGLALSETVGDIDQLLPLTRNAFTIATTSNRCAHLAIPINVQQAELVARKHFCLGRAYIMGRGIPATRLEIETMVMALRTEIESHRHVLIACGYRAGPYGEQVQRLAELMHAPILTSYDGKGTVNERHPLSFGVVGVYGNAGTPSSVNVLDDCDTVISICSSDLTELITCKSGLQIRRLIQIDQRLVAGDTLRFSPSAAFACGHLKHSLTQIIEGLERSMTLQVQHSLMAQKATSPTSLKRRSNLQASGVDRMRRRLSGTEAIDLNQILTHNPTTSEDIWAEVRKESFRKPVGTPSTYLQLQTESDKKDIESTTHCHPAVFFDIMKDKLESDSVICADIGDNALWMASCLAAKRGQTFLTSEHMGIMGFGLNAGLAASLADSPQTLVVAGDGGFQMSLNELATMKDHGSKNVLVVVIMNKRLGRVQNETWGAGLNADGCRIGSPDFVKLFESYGYPNGVRLSTSETDVIADAIDKGWKSAAENGCAVIELHQDPLIHPIMHKLPSSQGSRRSLVDFKRKIRNPEDNFLFPSLDVHLDEELQGSLLDWLNSLTKVEKSTPAWLDTIDLITNSPSRIVETQLAGLPIFSGADEPPKLFESTEEYDIFDVQFKASIGSCFSTETVQEIVSEGTSNTHPLCVQLLCCPKGFSFLPHAHPNAEIMLPLVGECWEKRFPGAPMPATMFQRSASYATHSSHPTPEDLNKLREQLKQPGICQFLESEKCVDRAIRQSRVLYNPPGSVHQSYTKEDGCLLFVLWSGLHANFDTK